MGHYATLRFTSHQIGRQIEGLPLVRSLRYLPLERRRREGEAALVLKWPF